MAEAQWADRCKLDVSVVVPAYNAAAHLPAALASVVDKGFREVVVVDDGSSDNTLEVMNRAAERHAEVVVVVQDNQGAAAARNRGVAACTSEWVTFLDSDDLLAPQWLEVISRAAVDSDIVTAGHRMLRRDPGDDGKIVRPRSSRTFPEYRVNFTHAGTYALRVELFEAVGGFAEDLPASQHTEFSLRLLDAARRCGWRVRSIDEPVMTYFLGVSGSIRSDDRAVATAARLVLERHGRLLASDRHRTGQLCAVVAVRSRRIGDLAAARTFAARAVRADPRHVRHWARLAALLVRPRLLPRRHG